MEEETRECLYEHNLAVFSLLTVEIECTKHIRQLSVNIGVLNQGKFLITYTRVSIIA